MPADPLDLTGTWHGTFAYPAHAGPATPFLATITEAGGGLSGTIIEIDQFYGQGTISAALAGHRAGTAVDFVKTYASGMPGYANPVDYVGRLSGDGLLVTGVWSLLEFDGTFEMEREAAAEAPHAVEESAAL